MMEGYEQHLLAVRNFLHPRQQKQKRPLTWWEKKLQIGRGKWKYKWNTYTTHYNIPGVVGGHSNLSAQNELPNNRSEFFVGKINQNDNHVVYPLVC